MMCKPVLQIYCCNGLNSAKLGMHSCRLGLRLLHFSQQVLAKKRLRRQLVSASLVIFNAPVSTWLCSRSFRRHGATLCRSAARRACATRGVALQRGEFRCQGCERKSE